MVIEDVDLVPLVVALFCFILALCFPPRPLVILVLLEQRFDRDISVRILGLICPNRFIHTHTHVCSILSICVATVICLESRKISFLY